MPHITTYIVQTTTRFSPDRQPGSQPASLVPLIASTHATYVVGTYVYICLGKMDVIPPDRACEEPGAAGGGSLSVTLSRLVAVDRLGGSGGIVMRDVSSVVSQGPLRGRRLRGWEGECHSMRREKRLNHRTKPHLHTQSLPT